MCCRRHWICGNRSQWTHPVRPDSIRTAQETGADIQPEPAGFRQLVLHVHDARGQARRHRTRRNRRTLAVPDRPERGPQLRSAARLLHEPRGGHRRTLREGRAPRLGQEVAAKMDGSLDDAVHVARRLRRRLGVDSSHNGRRSL